MARRIVVRDPLIQRETGRVSRRIGRRSTGGRLTRPLSHDRRDSGCEQDEGNGKTGLQHALLVRRTTIARPCCRAGCVQDRFQ